MEIGGSNTANSTMTIDDDELLHEALEFTQHGFRQTPNRDAYIRPIAIPQVGSGFGTPFARGYCDVLGNRGISMEEFLEFIDNYNLVSGGSPPFAILDLASGVVGMIPIHHAQAISGAITAVSKIGQLGSNAVNRSRASKFLETSNLDFFNPRGLKVEVATSKAVKAKLGMDPDTPLAIPAEESAGLSTHERRIASLRDYTSPVRFDVPAPNEQTATLKRMAAAQQKGTLQKQERKALEDREKYGKKKSEAEQKISEKSDKIEKEALKLDKEREKVMNKREKEVAKIDKDFEKESSKRSGDMEKAEKKKAGAIGKVDRDLQSELRKLDEERLKLDKEYEEEVRKETKDAEKDDKEKEASEKILWLFVENVQ